MAKSSKAVATVKQNRPPAQFGKSKYAGMGQETIESDDIFMPRLKLGQAMSPEVKDGILNEGDLFNSVTGEIICPAGEKIPAIVVMRNKEYILWDDRKGDDRGMLARAQRVMVNDQPRYAWNKPNETFEVKVDGKTKVKYKLGKFIDEDGLNEWGTQLPGNQESPPAVNEHQNFILALPDRDFELIAVSMSRTSVGVAKKLLTSLKMGSAAIFERQYELGSFIDNRGENKFANYQFSPGWTPVEEETADKMAEAFKGLAGKVINVDQSQDDEGQSSSKPGAKKSGKF